MVDEPVQQPEPPNKKAPGGAARTIAIVVLLIVGLLLGWYVLTDKLAPYSSVGAVNAFTTQIAPRVAGAVVGVSVQDNQAVKEGDILFELDPRPFDLTVAQSEASLRQAQQGVDSAQASLRSAQVRIDQAQATYDNVLATAERTRALRQDGVFSQAQADKAEADLASAQSALQIAQADYDSAVLKSGEVDASNPQLDLAQVQLDQARLNQEFATIRAPSDGVITNLRLAVGQFVPAGTAAMTFIATDSPWLMADLRENQLANVDVGDAVSIVFDGQPTKVYSGHVQGVAWGIDPGRTAANGLPQNQTSARWFEPARTIPVHVKLDSADWPQNVRVGSKVSVVIFAAGQDNPVAWVANALLHVQSYVSLLY